MSPEDVAQSDAMAACVERASGFFPSMTKDDGEALSGRMGKMKPDNWRVGGDGAFVLEVPDTGPNRSSPFLFTCSGNLKRRAIDLVELDGTAKRPPAGQTWSY